MLRSFGCDSADVEIEDDEFTFLSDGVYTCTATVSGTAIQDSEVIIVDTEGPEITVLTPIGARGQSTKTSRSPATSMMP